MIIEGGNLKVLLLRCARHPVILRNLSVVEHCFCFGVVWATVAVVALI